MISVAGIKALMISYGKVVAVLNRVILDYYHTFFENVFYAFVYIGFLVSFIYMIMSVSAIIRKEHKKEEAVFDENKAPFVTVQIPTRNEIIALRCAKKCLEFDYPKNKYEIIIGDDSNDKSVSKKLDEFASKHPNVRVIRRKQNIGFKPGNLNNMLRYTKGEIIVLFDSDFIPEKDFLRRIVVPFEEKKVSAVQARWKFINADKNMVTALASTIGYTFHHVSLALLNKFGHSFLCGSAEAVRKRDLIKAGGWKSGSLTEDIEYSLRIHKNGKKIVYLPKLECYNEAPSKPMDLYRQQMRWAHGVVSSYKIHTKDIISTDKLSAGKKSLTMIGAFGYLMPIIISMVFITGALSFVTHRPVPIDLPRFASETGRNILFTSGLLIASSVALCKAKKTRLILKMLVSSFSIGLITTYFVNKGIIKALLNKPVPWFLLKKSTTV